jgi:hypothetical protein
MMFASREHHAQQNAAQTHDRKKVGGCEKSTSEEETAAEEGREATC